MFSRIFQQFRAHIHGRICPQKKIYADYATLTPISDNVLSIMSSIYKQYTKNPSALYTSAVRAKKRLEEARLSVSRLLSGTSVNSIHADEVFFTSGGTESNNIAIQGVMDAWYTVSSEIPHIIISNIEHPAVKKVVEDLVNKKKVTASYVSVTQEGVVDLVDLKKVFDKEENIILVSIMFVNNEIGTIQPLKEVARMVRVYRKKTESVYPYFHTDACQAPCYLDMPIDKLGVDILTLDGGKIYGPQGVGCLYVKRGTMLSSIYKGGGQESGLRPGTENLPAIVGFSIALVDVYNARCSEVVRLREMQKYIYKNLPKDVFVNGTTDPEKRIVNNINICIPDSDSEFVVFQADVAGVEVSAVTACQNTQEESRSYVVDALGKKCGGSSIRISLGYYTNWKEVKKITQIIERITQKVGKAS